MSTGEQQRATEAFLHEKIPLTRAMGVQVASCDDDEGVVLTAPISANHNHLGTAFGGSLAALMMLAGYALLWLELRNAEAHVVVSETRMKFRRPVRGEIRATCRRPETAVLEKFLADFAAKGKARIGLSVVVTGEGESEAAVFEGTYVAFASER
jgi:thioesterase domain-containing protein